MEACGVDVFATVRNAGVEVSSYAPEGAITALHNRPRSSYHQRRRYWHSQISTFCKQLVYSFFHKGSQCKYTFEVFGVHAVLMRSRYIDTQYVPLLHR